MAKGEGHPPVKRQQLRGWMGDNYVVHFRMGASDFLDFDHIRAIIAPISPDSVNNAEVIRFMMRTTMEKYPRKPKGGRE